MDLKNYGCRTYSLMAVGLKGVTPPLIFFIFFVFFSPVGDPLSRFFKAKVGGGMLKAKVGGGIKSKRRSTIWFF
jgi:hypothetical protein